MNHAVAIHFLFCCVSMGQLVTGSLSAAEFDVENRAPQSMERFTKAPAGTDWVGAGLNTNRSVWGIRGGLLWGLPPASGKPTDGPRGLIRLWYPVLPGGDYDLINFIAVEPVVRGQRGYSELEASERRRMKSGSLSPPTRPILPPSIPRLQPRIGVTLVFPSRSIGGNQRAHGATTCTRQLTPATPIGCRNIPFPGGVAFENFELRERFYQDQRFVFGITRRTPKDI
jgi:hypothetical protein